MTKTVTVPLFIIEEHHEAFFIWNYGYFNGIINPVGNTLLHVDSHADMESGWLNSSIDELADDLKEIYTYVYQEFGIASFIIPAIYRGIVNNYTFLSRYDDYSDNKKNKYVASYKSEGKLLKTGEVNNLLRLQLQSAKNQWGKYQFYSYQEIGLGSKFTASQPLILDIDLDYFSCDNALTSVEKKIEITEAAYCDFINNKYHPFRIMPVAALTAKKGAGGYYLHYIEWQELPNQKKVSLSLINKRINKFIDFLEQNNIQPILIDVCRSRLSGYTPIDQWKYIENRLIQGLGKLYNLNISRISEFDNVYGGNPTNGSNRTRSDKIKI
ncbi:MAG: hypothetical protein FH758_10780 [Firmicutes bacterium]|nr:hypothetical protein [Bacillota bacterium]